MEKETNQNLLMVGKHVARPKNPENVSDREWSEYVFIRANPKGIYYERWVHTHGCKKWFNAVRNTSTDEILKVYKIGEAKPPIKEFKIRSNLLRENPI